MPNGETRKKTKEKTTNKTTNKAVLLLEESNYLHTAKKHITNLFAFFPVFDTISVLHTYYVNYIFGGLIPQRLK